MQQLLSVLPVHILPTFFISLADLEPVLSVLEYLRGSSDIGLTTLKCVFIVDITTLCFQLS